MENGQTISTTGLSAVQREVAEERIVAAVTAWHRNFINESFELADYHDKKVNWTDLYAVADHSCGLLAMYLTHDIVEEVEEILTSIMTSQGEK
jgi:hypothetical protein